MKVGDRVAFTIVDDGYALGGQRATGLVTEVRHWDFTVEFDAEMRQRTAIEAMGLPFGAVCEPIDEIVVA